MGARFGEELTITIAPEHSSQPNASQILQQLAELF
jgi:hypothetical protein